MDHVRPAAVAGLFYPSDPAALARTVDRLLEEAHAARGPVGQPVKGIVAPHAGYAYSGSVAAAAYEAAEGASAVAYPQYWKRNTLVVDLQSAPPSGRMTMRPRSPDGWPVRLALRVTPGAIGQLEVQAAQRVLLPVDAGAKPPVDLELAPSIYRRDTPAIVVSWGQSPPVPGT